MHWRSAITGRFLRRSDAEPDTSVAETVSDAPEVEANLRWRAGVLEAEMLGAAGSLRRLDDDRAAYIASELERVARARIPEETV